MILMSNKDERLINLGNKIAHLRKAKKFSQVKFAILLGISREHLSKIERGAASPSIKLLFEISKQTGCDITISYKSQ